MQRPCGTSGCGALHVKSLGKVPVVGAESQGAVWDEAAEDPGFYPKTLEEPCKP